MIARLRSNPHWLILGAIVLLAALLRFYKIDAQSLWYDEGNSARIAERSIQLIVEGAAGDIHPPLYYIILKYWRAVFGEGEGALRSFSAICGVLTVAFAYLIGRDLFDRRVGLVAAFLLAVAPFAVYYSQEARMYALLALCAAASTWAMLRVIVRATDSIAPAHRIGIVLLYVLATAAGLWIQYAYPFVMIAQGVCVVAFTIYDLRSAIVPNRQSAIGNRKYLITYIAASLIAIAFYLPWAPIAIRQIVGWGVERQAIVLGEAVLDVVRTLIAGRTLPLDQAALPMIGFGAFMLAGFLLPDARRQMQTERRASFITRLVLLVLATLPLILLFVFGLYRDAYLKFLLVCLTPMCVLAGRGINEIGDWGMEIAKRRFTLHSPTSSLVSAGLALFLVITFIPSLRNLYDNSAYARDDYRGVQRLIAQSAGEDAAVLFLAPNQWEVYTYYQKNDHNLFPLTYRPASYDDVARQMSEITATHPRIFALFFAERDADPEGWYELWMSGNLNKAHEEWIGNIRMAVYDAGVGRESWSVSPGAHFGDAIELIEARGRFDEAHEGDVLPIELTWRTDQPLDRRYKVFVHIGLDDGAPVAQNDGEPAAGYRPTNAWSVNKNITDKRGVWIKPGTPRGTYGVYVGLYDLETGQRLPVLKEGQPAGDRLKIGEITIAP